MIQNVGVVWFTNFLMAYFKNGPTTPTTFYWAHFIENKRMWIDHEIEAFVSI
jgi:hypothetical protein